MEKDKFLENTEVEGVETEDVETEGVETEGLETGQTRCWHLHYQH